MKEIVCPPLPNDPVEVAAILESLTEYYEIVFPAEERETLFMLEYGRIPRFNIATRKTRQQVIGHVQALRYLVIDQVVKALR